MLHRELRITGNQLLRDAAAKFYGSVIGWRIGARSDFSHSGKDYRMIGRSEGGFEGGVFALTADMVSHGGRPGLVT
jgi:uncharacterized protein